ncbi:diacylglycerol kinase family protein [Staphylococcus massiliensis]|uniref:Diacylglycerol kinase n=1 Tax=Staphylococcus massiliensis S46 TaxID=1229783 RepID=K9ARM7_9STAP|nr:diacylglycerol kinase family protein [Staphylococcus massiliensis]EKU49909.1 Diacylglycerol kinase [Staphylococcus massiliensis S46]MCG3399013.1 diacylglycerol kinase family protein [Staphylococcus massiliensis]MCG3400989.1 diacylglycerol kinase family protein [Staphylococcus massiliensis]MCG3412524.1 diacylglycerol kinase family protein [Staphylococcus massiliensis]PNZ98909.1 diacylglycerol kinase [Staphylococcus massiliensis CCUG 55927]
MKRFKYAFEGCIQLFKKDHNFLLHIVLMIIAIIFGIICGISPIEWMILTLVIGLVLAFEVINTALEYVVDLVTLEYHDYAKYAKDIAAFSVVIMAIVAVIIGIIIFIPKLI